MYVWSWPTWCGCPECLCSVGSLVLSVCRRLSIVALECPLPDRLVQETLGLPSACSAGPGEVQQPLCSHPTGPAFSE